MPLTPTSGPKKAPGTAAAAVPVAVSDELRWLRMLVWVYLSLWVFEGALRKWIVPSLANPLLVVRDPVLLLMYAVAYVKGVFPRSAFIPWIAGLGLLATLVSLFFTNTSMVVTLFGLRADYLHLPLIFLLPEVLRRSDLKILGQAVLALAIGMSFLVLLQFRANAGSFLNAGAGENTVMLDSAFGHIRPSGTFSYTNGLTGFTALTAAFFLQHLLEKRVYPRLIWLGALPALLLLVVLSGSRAAAATTALILLGVVFINVVQSRYRLASFKLAALLGVAMFLVGSFAVFRSGLDVFSNRFASHKVEQSGFLGRALDSFAQPFIVTEKADWMGAGLGAGTNVASGLTTGERKFTFSEGEGGRIVLENGPIVGFAFIALRFCIVVYLGLMAVQALRVHGATLPVLLFSGCFNDLLLGQFSQATELGYATIAGGICLTASLRAGEPLPVVKEAETIPVAARPERQPATPVQRPAPAVPSGRPAVRGRSVLAAQLHGSSAEEARP